MVLGVILAVSAGVTMPAWPASISRICCVGPTEVGVRGMDRKDWFDGDRALS